eukprot:COSAG02_NODE_23009_length_732_cov_1.789889_1_plen_112_part_01
MDAGATWPANLQVLVGLAPMQECLAGLGIDSLDSFADEFDLEEGHEAAVQAVLAALPTKPKKARQQRNRAQFAFADLVQRLLAMGVVAVLLIPSLLAHPQPQDQHTRAKTQH